MADYSTVDFEVRDKVGYVTLNRPEKLNAINHQMIGELFEVFEEVKFNPDIWAMVITGTGRAFSTGHDLVEMATTQPVGRHGSATAFYQYLQELYKPTIAAINGYCLAQGGGIALSCDIRIASDQAQFGWPQVKRGISSTSGPTILCQRIPLNIAMEMLFTGEFIDPKRAMELNLVNKVVPHEQLMDEVEAMVRKIMNNAPLAVRAIKEVGMRGLNLQMEERVRLAGLISGVVGRSEDSKEGLQAFAEKREPVWKGR
jgi:enoyl-CoA hydratase/carnithine racemase